MALLLVRGARPERSPLSRFELERRLRAGKPGAEDAIRREDLLHDIYSFQHVLTAVLLVTISALGVLLFHWTVGFLVSLLIALESGAVARLKLVWKPANLLYGRIESKLLDLIERFPRVFKLLRTVAPLSGDQYMLHSQEELLEIVNQADSAAISDQQKRLITNGLQFETRQIKEIMTPREEIKTVKRKEMLGPLVLDELHKTGHSRFPVIDKDVDHVVGVLHIRSLLSLDHKRTVTAEKAMEPEVYFIRHDQTLAYALAAFLRTRHHLFIVIDGDQRTTGVVSLEDVIEALLGHDIRDEFDVGKEPKLISSRS